MSEMSMIRSLLLFDQRVLSLGRLLPDTEYSMNELQNTMRFNQIYMSNMDELFRTQNKYKSCINPYLNDIKIIDNNMIGIINTICEIDNSIKIDDNYDSFECRLTVMKLLEDNLNSTITSLDKINDYNFKPGIIYYIISVGDAIIISYINPKLLIYKTPISFEYDKFSKYWKTDMAILSYLKNNYESDCAGVSLIVTKSRKGRNIIKFEMNGYDGDMNHISDILNKYIDGVFIVRNKYLYMDDINQIIKGSDRYKHAVKAANVYSYENYKGDFSMMSIFDRDIMVEYPDDSFDIYLQLLHQASIDANVESIYITLYRIGDNPIIYYILSDAVRRGIKVHINLELRASEENINKFWANEMRSAGIDVSHHADGYLKVHCKLTLIKFKNGTMISQIGTGNYHSETTTQYTDLSLMTANKSICSRIDDLFNMIVHGAKNLSVNDDLLITRYNARKKLNKLIKDQGRLGTNGNIFIKCNSFDDNEISRHLTDAANNGCTINLIIRGICTWIPPEGTLNNNVTIRSIVWDKLEHSRLYVFGQGVPTIYMGSLDLMTHKLDDRIETLVKINDGNIIKFMCNYIDRYSMMDSWYMVRSKTGRILYNKRV